MRSLVPSSFLTVLNHPYPPNLPPFPFFLFGFPIFHHILLPADCSLPPNPEHTGTLQILHSEMVENDCRLATHPTGVKRILHEHKNVYVTRVGFCGDEGAKHN